MAISVTIGEPKIEGLELMSPADSEFDTTVRTLFKGNCNKLLKMKPFLTIVSNHSDRTLVAYALKWEVARASRRQITLDQHKYPDAVSAAPRRGNEIRPGEQNIALMSIELNCGRFDGEATEDFYLRQFIGWFKEYKDARDLEISIDAAIFEDGAFFGPNKSELDQHFRAYVDAKQDYYRMIVQALNSGMSLDDAFAPVEAVLKGNIANPDLHSENVGTMWRRIAASEVRSWRTRYGNEAAPEIYRRALRSEPFEIRGSVNRLVAETARLLSHVACPRCRYSPKSTDRWQCNCRHSWNTFDTRGLCPACGCQWKETACLVCGELSLHADWYLPQ